MKRTILTGILAMAAGIACLAAQAPSGKPPAVPQAKSQPELKAVQAMLGSQDPDATIKAAEDLLTKYADTQFKEAALAMEAEAYRSKNDVIKAQIYADQALALNPANLQANILTGEVIIQNTKPLALDRDEQLAKAQKCLTAAQDALKVAVKPNPKMSDLDWSQFRSETSASIHNDFGMLASVRKNWDVAITEFQAAIADTDQPAFQARLALSYLQAGKSADSLALCDKILATPQLNPAIKSYVTSVRASAAAKVAPPAPATPAPAPQK